MPEGIQLSHCMLGNFSCVFSLLISFLNELLIKSFLDSIRLNSLNPVQAQPIVRPDLGPNCFKRLSADNKLSLAVRELRKSLCIYWRNQ